MDKVRVPRLAWLVVGLALVLQPVAAIPKFCPPDAAAALKKLAGNEALSPAELKALSTWYRAESTLGPFDDEPEEYEPGDPRADLLQSNPNVKLAEIAPPSKDGLLALAKEAQALYGARLDAVVRQQLDLAIQQSERVGYGADLGAVLLASQNAEAAVYAMAAETLKHPEDALTINNLGAALKGLREYPWALKILLYAHQQDPKLVLATTNLGWTQAMMGDLTTAQQTFEIALATDPEDSLAQEGLGLIAMARGDRDTAMRMLIASIKGIGGSRAQQAVKVLADPEEVLGHGEETEAQARAALDLRADTAPMEHRRGRGGGAPPTFVPPPNLDTYQDALANYDAVQAWARRATEQLLPRVQQHTQLGLAAGQAAMRREMDAGPNVVLRDYERERAALLQIMVVYDNRISRLEYDCDFVTRRSRCIEQLQALIEQYQQDNDKAKFCQQSTKLTEAYYNQVYPLWKSFRDRALHEAIEYYHAATPWLEDLGQPLENQLWNLDREIHLRVIDSNIRSLLTHLLEPLQTIRIFGCAEQHQAGDPEGDDDVGQAASKPCQVSTFVIKLKLLSLEGSCEKLKLEVGQGLFGSIEYKPGATRERDELTIFAGAGVDYEDPNKIISFDAKAGGYVTVRGDGQLVDVGLQESLGATVKLGNLTAGVEFEGRLGVESGLNGGLETKYGVDLSGQ